MDNLVKVNSPGKIILGNVQGEQALVVITNQCLHLTFLLDSLAVRECSVRNTIPSLVDDASIDRGVTMSGPSSCRRYFIKIGIEDNPRKKNNLTQEAEILRHLTNNNCMSSPSLIWCGDTVIGDSAMDILCASLQHVSPPVEKIDSTIGVIVMEYIEDTKETTMSDLLCAVMEQKALGVFQGDLRQDNIRCCPRRKQTFLLDYDQAVFIPDEDKSLNGLDFMRWCDTYAQERYKAWGFKGAWDYFPDIKFETHIEPYFVKGVFNVGLTTMFKSQETTLHPSKIYHMWDTVQVFAQGERDLDERIPWLEQIIFEPNETVLDVGCNSGLLCKYLDEKGCQVTGIDIDPHIIQGAKIINNMHGGNIEFYHVDLDQQPILGKFDTIMLFSVIHHTKNLFENCKKVARSANRILVECRFEETGAKPLFNGKWISTTIWKHEDIESMRIALEGMFENFQVNQVYGPGDRNRYLLEMINSKWN